MTGMEGLSDWSAIHTSSLRSLVPGVHGFHFNKRRRTCHCKNDVSMRTEREMYGTGKGRQYLYAAYHACVLKNFKHGRIT